MTKPAISESPETPDGPAVVQADHIQSRHVHTRAGGQLAWYRRPIYEREHLLGHLICKERCKGPQDQETLDEIQRALNRYHAAKAFDEGWRICNASWPAGSDLNRVRVVGCPGSFVDHQRDTKNFWRRVEAAMGTRDWMICRRVCGDNYKVAETIHDISPSYRLSTLARFREALDVLIEGMESARRS